MTVGVGSSQAFVGRAFELEVLASLVERVVEGEAFFAVLVGEAGIGKTSLALHAGEGVRQRGMATVWARASDVAAVPYGLWRDVLLDVPGTASPPPATDAPPVITDPLRERAEERLARFEVVLDALRAAAPVVVVLDDVHMADDSSLQLLHHVVRCRPRGVGFIATARAVGSSAPEILRAVVNESSTTRVDLGGLGIDDVRQVLERHGVGDRTGLAAVVHRRTGGNAFLVRELSLLVAERIRAGEDAIEAAGAVPRSVVDVAAHRLRALGALAVDVLTAGAVLGERFAIGVVARMLDCPALELLGAVDEATGAGLVVPERSGELRFTHALLHEAIAGLYEGRLRRHLGDLARHWEAAGPLVGYGPPARAAIAAADAAAEDLAFEDAVRWYERVLAIGEPAVDIDTLDAVRIRLAQAALSAGDVDTWQRASMEAATSAERPGDAATMAEAALAMEAIGFPPWDRQVWRVCAATRAVGQTEEVTARLLAREAQAHSYLNESLAADTASVEALRLARRSGSAVALVDALRARQLERSSPDGLAEREQLTEELAALAAELADPVAELWSRLWRLDTLFERGRFPLVGDELRALARAVERVPGPLARWHLLITRAAYEQAMGRFSDALDHAHAGFVEASTANHPSAFGGFAALTSVVCWHVGIEVAGIGELLADPPARVTDAEGDDGLVGPFPVLAEAMVRAMAGDVEGGGRALERAGRPSTWRPTPALHLSCLGLAARAAAATGDRAVMTEVRELLLPFAENHLTSSAGQASYLGPCALALGSLAAALGRFDEAVPRLETAATIADENGTEPFAVEARVVLADALTGRDADGDAGWARSLLDVAEPAARRLGMVPFTERIADLRRSSRAPREVRSAGRPSPLSPRELEVAALVAAGASNREIARELVISERTAQNHVQHILTKLAASNRTQIAGWYRDHTDLDG